MIYCCLHYLFLRKHFWILILTDKSYYFKFLVTKQEYNLLLFVLDINIDTIWQLLLFTKGEDHHFLFHSETAPRHAELTFKILMGHDNFILYSE